MRLKKKSVLYAIVFMAIAIEQTVAQTVACPYPVSYDSNCGAGVNIDVEFFNSGGSCGVTNTTVPANNFVNVACTCSNATGVKVTVLVIPLSQTAPGTTAATGCTGGNITLGVGFGGTAILNAP